MKDWNVVATARERRFREAVHLLKQFGQVEKTHFYDVLVMTVDDPREFLKRLHVRLNEDPAIGQIIGHVAPCSAGFIFQSAKDFEEKSHAMVRMYVADLAEKRFHVRLHRRGFKETLRSPQVEQALDQVLLKALEEARTPGQITFADPDAILALETVDGHAGMALWTREDLRQYPLLHLD